jgi:hypothetical protein
MAGNARNDDRVDKRRVTMTSVLVSRDEHGVLTRTIEAVDYVRADILDAYVIDARRRWADVHVSEEPDAGPAGYDGATFVPFGTVAHVFDAQGQPVGQEWHEFGHELAGSYFPASDCKKCTHAPEHPLEVGRKARLIRAEG